MNIGLEEEKRQKAIELLRKLLADHYVLAVKTQNYHWNVEGLHFNDLHSFFEKQYDELQEQVDEIAERIRMLGGKALGSLSTFLSDARLTEETSTSVSASQMVSNLLADRETVIRTIREEIEVCDDLDDVGTEDFLTGLMQNHEKAAWMLRSMTKN